MGRIKDLTAITALRDTDGFVTDGPSGAHFLPFSVAKSILSGG